MTYETIQTETRNHTAYITINRPKALNALNEQVLKELLQAFMDVQNNQNNIRAVVLTGSGDKAFVAGADIPSMKEMSVLDADEFCSLGHCCMRVIEMCSMPVIAAVNGFALGGGLELALSCDFIYASSNAKLGLPEVSLGLFPGFGGTQRLTRVIGRARAKELMYTADVITAQEACELGLVNKVTKPGDLMLAVEETVAKIVSKAPIAVRLAKRTVNEGADLPLASGLSYEQAQFPLVFATEDRQEGITAFLEKRAADFKNT